MTDFDLLLIGGAGLLGVGLAVFLLRSGAWNWQPALSVAASPGERLGVLMGQRPDYTVLIGVPPAKPDRWASAWPTVGRAVAVEGHGDIPLAKVRAYLVAYPNGQLVDCELAGLTVPEGLAWLSPSRTKAFDILQAGDLDEGRRYIRVEFGPSALRPRDRNHYSTTLTNLSRQSVRVLRFAAYVRTRKGFRLSTVTGTFYLAEEFNAWYGLDPDGWIAPGASVADQNNYGSPPMLWAYYCETEEGEQFIAGGVLE